MKKEVDLSLNIDTNIQNLNADDCGNKSRFKPEIKNKMSNQTALLKASQPPKQGQIRSRDFTVYDRARNKWNREDDLKLMNLVDRYGENFESLCCYFPKRSSNDLAIRYYKKIKHTKMSFTMEEDRIISKLYRCEALNIDELEALQKKDSESINHRLKSLLRDQDEEIRQDFNVSSTLSKIRIAATKSTSRTEDQTYLSKEKYNFSNFNREKAQLMGNLSESVSYGTKQDFIAINPFENNQLFTVRRKDAGQSHFAGNDNLHDQQSIIAYKKYREDTTFIEGLSIRNSHHQLLADTNNSIASLFEFEDTGQLYNNMLMSSDAVDESLNFSHILDLGQNYENLAEEDLNLNFRDLNKDLKSTETLQAGDTNSLSVLQTYISKKENFEGILNKFNHLTCAMEREFYYKMGTKSKEVLARIKQQESALFRQLIDVKVKISEIETSNIPEYLPILRTEIDIQLKLIYLSKRKLDALSLNICEK